MAQNERKAEHPKPVAPKMGDLEMTKLCAEAMGCATKIVDDRGRQIVYAQRQPENAKADWFEWNPLNGLVADAQAMALVKKFELHLHPPVPNAAREWWVHSNEYYEGREAPKFGGSSTDLNRAIVECVSKMRRSAKA